MPKPKKVSLREGNNGFTLIEVAIILVLIGLLIGLGASLIGPLTKRVKVQDTRERIDAAVESVLGYAVATKRLPNGSEFQNNVRNPKDAWGKDLRYVVWGNFTNGTNVICPSDASQHGFKVTVSAENGTRTISNVAFLIISSGPNYNLQTRFNGTNNVWSIKDNNENITIYLPGANKDDFPADGNFTDYDDIVKWVTVYELMQRVCYGEERGDEGPLRIITYSLPIGKQNEPYSAEIIAVGGVKPYTWSFSTNIQGVSAYQSGDLLKLNGTPSCPGSYNFNATVKDSKNNTASRTFTLSIQPDHITFTPVSGTTWYATNGTSFPTTNIYVTGGRPPYTSTCVNNNCPTLTCSANNNIISISGTTPTNPTTCYFNVTTSDSCPQPNQQTTSATYAVVIQAPSGGGGGGGCNPMSLNPTSGTTWSATVGQSFSRTISVSGGNGSRTNTECYYSETGSSSCRGLSISCNSDQASISGTPNSQGTCTAKVSWRDSCTPPQTISGTYTINISTPPSCPSLSLNPPSGTIFVANLGEPFYQRIDLSGGVPPYTNIRCNPSACKGLNLTCYSNYATITGSPNALGNCSFEVGWRDSCSLGSQTIYGNYTVRIFRPPQVIVDLSIVLKRPDNIIWELGRREDLGSFEEDRALSIPLPHLRGKIREAYEKGKKFLLKTDHFLEDHWSNAFNWIYLLKILSDIDPDPRLKLKVKEMVVQFMDHQKNRDEELLNSLIPLIALIDQDFKVENNSFLEYLRANPPIDNLELSNHELSIISQYPEKTFIHYSKEVQEKILKYLLFEAYNYHSKDYHYYRATHALLYSYFLFKNGIIKDRALIKNAQLKVRELNKLYSTFNDWHLEGAMVLLYTEGKEYFSIGWIEEILKNQLEDGSWPVFILSEDPTKIISHSHPTGLALITLKLFEKYFLDEIEDSVNTSLMNNKVEITN